MPIGVRRHVRESVTSIVQVVVHEDVGIAETREHVRRIELDRIPDAFEIFADGILDSQTAAIVHGDVSKLHVERLEYEGQRRFDLRGFRRSRR